MWRVKQIKSKCSLIFHQHSLYFATHTHTLICFKNCKQSAWFSFSTLFNTSITNTQTYYTYDNFLSSKNIESVLILFHMSCPLVLCTQLVSSGFAKLSHKFYSICVKLISFTKRGAREHLFFPFALNQWNETSKAKEAAHAPHTTN